MHAPYLTDDSIDLFIASALKEDIGHGDHSTLGSVSEDASSKAQLILKSEGILAGVELARRIFSHVDPQLEIDIKKYDGDSFEVGDIALFVSGSSRSILSTERLVLNCMQRMSAVATYTNHMRSLIKGTKARILDTRKTTPLFRLPEKWAVLIGGG